MGKSVLSDLHPGRKPRHKNRPTRSSRIADSARGNTFVPRHAGWTGAASVPGCPSAGPFGSAGECAIISSLPKDTRRPAFRSCLQSVNAPQNVYIIACPCQDRWPRPAQARGTTYSLLTQSSVLSVSAGRNAWEQTLACRCLSQSGTREAAGKAVRREQQRGSREVQRRRVNRPGYTTSGHRIPSQTLAWSKRCSDQPCST